MPLVGGLLGLIGLALWIFALADLITRDESDCRHLPKLLWLLLVLFVPFAGSVLWLAVGRPRRVGSARGTSLERSAPAFPEYDRPGRFAAPDAESDAEFLRKCRERAEEQRRKARGENDS